MVIPRENSMVRLYIRIASSSDPDFDPRKTATEQEVQTTAKKILSPYIISWENVDWFSVYPIGQGIAATYTLDQRVFLGGDACHTHSVSREHSALIAGFHSITLDSADVSSFVQPKAGQGMNTAFLDAQNLAWKIHAVESGFASRDILKTYEAERKAVAEELLSFDNKYAKLFSQHAPPRSAQGLAETHSNGGDASSARDHINEFVDTFKEFCAFTSGYGVKYGPSEICWSPSHAARSKLISPKGVKLNPGRLMVAVDVTRVSDANVVALEQEIPENGAFRIYIFAGVPSESRLEALRDFAHHSNSPVSYLAAYLRPDAAAGGDGVSYHEKHNRHSHHFAFSTILAAKHEGLENPATILPPLLAQYRDHVYADDVTDRRLSKGMAAAHRKIGVDLEQGLVLVVRPDGYVGVSVALVQGTGTVEALNEYFGAFVTKKLGLPL